MWIATVRKSNAVMSVSLVRSDIFFSIFYLPFLSSQSEIDFGTALIFRVSNREKVVCNNHMFFLVPCVQDNPVVGV